VSFLSSLAGWLPGWFGPPGSVRRIGDASFAVVDVDVTGASIRDDRVTGIAVLPVAAGAFRISDLRYCALANDADGRVGGAEARAAYLAMKDAVAGTPLVTYNPNFVREMIERSCRAGGLPPLGGEWIDLAAAAGVVGSEEHELATMDYWLARMEAGGPRRHDAVYDTFAMAQLLLAVLAYAEDAGIDTVDALARSEDLRVWLRRRA
jgi:DNA polymerase III alpha subunit (gram-positive type)